MSIRLKQRAVLRVIIITILLTLAAWIMPTNWKYADAMTNASYKNAVVGEWKIDEVLTTKVNGASMRKLFGSSYAYENGMKIFSDSSFSYYVAAGNGGDGTWKIKASNLYYEIIRYEDQSKEKGTIRIAHGSDGQLRLAMSFYNEFDVYWKKVNHGKITRPQKAVLTKIFSNGKGKLKLTWKRDQKASGYQAMVATDKKFTKNKKVSTIKNNKATTKTFKKLQRKKVYYARVRSYKKSGNTTIYSAYSKVWKTKI